MSKNQTETDIMKLPNGQTRHTQSYYSRRNAALNYARRFLTARAAGAGLTYTEGDGRNTLAGYNPE